VIQKYDVQDLQVVGLAVPTRTTPKEAASTTPVIVEVNGSDLNSEGPTWLIFILVVLFFVAVSLLQFYYMYACIKTEKPDIMMELNEKLVISI